MSKFIPVCNLKGKTERYHSEISYAITKVVESGWFVLGPEVLRFERKFADYIGVEHCCTVANGTDALELALRAVGVRTGDSVATVANAGMYTTTALLAIDAEPFFLDVDIDSHVVTLSEVERAISKGVKAVVVTHLYGLAVPDVKLIAELCRNKKVPLIEDCAQAHGACIGTKQVGTWGDIGCFSFYPTKNLGALGDGGAVITNNAVIAEKVTLLRQYGWVSKYRVALTGAKNSRLDEMQAAILSEFLPFLNSWNQRRREIAQQYSERIYHSDVILPELTGEDYVAHLYVIRSPKRDLLQAHLRENKIGSEVHYPIPDYRQPIFATKSKELMLPNTEKLAREILTLPCYPEMTDEEVDTVIRAVNKW